MRSVLYLLTLLVLSASRAHGQCILNDYYRLSVIEARDGRETSAGALCPNPPRNDLTRQYVDGVGDIGPRVFFSSLEEDLVNFNHPFCLAFTMLTTNSSNSAPLMSIVSASSAEPVFSLVIDSNGVTLTLGTSSVTFPAPQFADGNAQQLQICTDGAQATLYSNCVSLGSLPFSGSSAADFNNAILFVLRSVTTEDVFQGTVQQLYAVQCPVIVAQQNIANGQCAALSRDCTQPTQSRTPISPPTTTLPPTGKSAQ